MERETVQAELKEFAEKRLNAEAYADCTHRFTLFECGKCRGLSFAVTIERHGADSPGDFHGILRTACAGCGNQEEKLGVVSEADARVSATEHPVCDCGGSAFHVGMCERWEDWGFFDEGTAVAMCAACGSLKDLVDTD